jgi:hypothetical protein
MRNVLAVVPKGNQEMVAAAISTGCTALRKTRANAPYTMFSSRCSNRCRPPTSASFPVRTLKSQLGCRARRVVRRS